MVKTPRNGKLDVGGDAEEKSKCQKIRGDIFRRLSKRAVVKAGSETGELIVHGLLITQLSETSLLFAAIL